MTTWLVFLHVLGAVIWVGAQIYIEALMAGASRTGDTRVFMRTAERVLDANRVIFIVGPALALIFGIWLVIERWGLRAGFEQLWVTLAFILVLVSAGLGIFFHNPKSKQVTELIAERGLEDEEAVALVKRIGNVSHVDTLIVVFILALMIFKPG